jgi:tetratricopeptide (TPR) repeat protein
MKTVSRIGTLRRAVRSVACVIVLAGVPSLVTAHPIHSNVGRLAPELLPQSTPRDAPRVMSELRGELDRAVQSFRRGEHTAALSILERAVLKHPELPPAKLMLARLSLQTGEFAKARAMLRRAADEKPSYPGIYITFAELALAEGQLGESKENFERALNLIQDQRWTGQRKRLLPRILEGLIVTAARSNDWSSAKKHASTWLELDPANASVRQRFAQALFRLGDTKRAHVELQKGAAADRSIEPAPVSMARLYADGGDLRKAVEWMDTAIRIEPTNPRWQRTKATLLLRHGDAARAARQMDATAKLDGNASETRMLRGLVARYMRDYLQAERIFEVLHRTSPTDASVSNQLALALIEQPEKSKQDRALHLAAANARLFDASGEALSTLGWVYYRLGRLEDAERTLLAAYWFGFESADAAYYLARVLAERNRIDRARQFMNAALHAQGLFLYRNEAQRWLQQTKTRGTVDTGVNLTALPK